MSNSRINALPAASASASDDYLVIDGATNGTRSLNGYSPTFGGNLTVSSGTITGGTTGLTLAAAGANQNVTLTPSGGGINVLTGKTAAGALNSGSVSSFDAATVLRTSGNITIDGSGRNALGAVAGITSAMADSASIGNFVGTVITSYSNAANWVGATFFSTKNGAASSSEVARFAGNGNLLIGTTTDSSNGKIQLAAHSTSAGGIGLGTSAVIYNNGSSGIIFGTNGSTTALTLDSSQNATFAGAVQATTASLNHLFGTNSGSIYDTNAGADAKLYFPVTSTGGGGSTAAGVVLGNSATGSSVSFFRNNSASKRVRGAAINGSWTNTTAGAEACQITIGVQVAGASPDSNTALTIAGTGITVGGSVTTSNPVTGTAKPWKMGSYNGGAPAATGYVEVDVNGTLYKLLAST